MVLTHHILFLVLSPTILQASVLETKSAQISSSGRISPAQPHSFTPTSRTMRDARDEGALLEVDGTQAMDEDPWSGPGAFAQYKRMYKRTYPIGSEEHDRRESLFQQRISEMKAHNARGESWSKGVNQFTDWTADEMQKLLGYRRSVHRSQEVVSASLLDEGSTMNSTSQRKTCLKKSTTCGGAAHCCQGLACSAKGTCKACQHYSKRQSVDWSHTIKGAQRIFDQGSCGSCWAIAAAGAIEAQVSQLDPTNSAVRVSPEEILQCSPNPRHCGGDGGCQGSTPELAFAWAAKNRMSKIQDQPYSAQDLVATDKKKVCPAAGQDDDASMLDTDSEAKTSITIGGYVHLPLNKAESVMQALVCVGPVVVAASASSWFAYSGGVLTCGKDSDSLTVDHAILMVGFGKENHHHYWKIRNSWGTDFGEEGFIRLKRHPKGEPCGKDLDMQKGIGCRDDPKVGTVCGECGVLSDTAYPVGAKIAGPTTASSYMDESQDDEPSSSDIDLDNVDSN